MPLWYSSYFEVIATFSVLWRNALSEAVLLGKSIKVSYAISSSF